MPRAAGFSGKIMRQNKNFSMIGKNRRLFGKDHVQKQKTKRAHSIQFEAIANGMIPRGASLDLWRSTSLERKGELERDPEKLADFSDKIMRENKDKKSATDST